MSHRLIISTHAVDRARQRYDRSFTRNRIAADVQDALDEGRCGCKAPQRFNAASTERGRKLRQHRGRRFAWTPDESRCYVYIKARGNGRGGPVGEKLVIVKTALSSALSDRAAA